MFEADVEYCNGFLVESWETEGVWTTAGLLCKGLGETLCGNDGNDGFLVVDN